MMYLNSGGNNITNSFGTAESSTFGIAYATTIPSVADVMSIIDNTPDLSARMVKLSNTDAYLSDYEYYTREIKINRIYEEDGLTMMDANISGERKIHLFRVTYCSDSDFYITFKRRSGVYSFRIGAKDVLDHDKRYLMR